MEFRLNSKQGNHGNRKQFDKQKKKHSGINANNGQSDHETGKHSKVTNQ